MDIFDFVNPSSGLVYRRVNKTKARRMYNGGFPIVMCRHGGRPFHVEWNWVPIKIDDHDGPDRLFENRLEMISWATKEGNEKGTYADFYVRVDYLINDQEQHLIKKRKNSIPMYMRG